MDKWEPVVGLPGTELRESQGVYWLSSPAFGGIRFDLSCQKIAAYPNRECAPGPFEEMLVREWLPLVFQAWGYQVLHASAAVHLHSRRLVALAGAAGTGKSTLGYALGQRPGWQQVADESLALRFEGGRVQPVPIPNRVRLRRGSAAYLQPDPSGCTRLEWPAFEPCLSGVFFLEPIYEPAGREAEIRVEAIDGAEAYPLLLNQAFAITLQRHDENRRLMRDYLAVAGQAPAYRLVYPKSFSHLTEILDLVERQVLPAG